MPPHIEDHEGTEYRPRVLPGSTLASGPNAHPAEATSGCGGTGIIPRLRMDANGETYASWWLTIPGIPADFPKGVLSIGSRGSHVNNGGDPQVAVSFHEEGSKP